MQGNRQASQLDYLSSCPTFALAFSPLSTTTPSLKLAVGSFIETRGEPNNVTIVGLDPNYLDFTGDYQNGGGGADDPFAYGGQRKSAFVPLARANHVYPPSAIGFSPAVLSSSLQSSNSGTMGEATREMVATSSDCLRLFDLVGDDGMGGMGGGGFVGSQRMSGGTRLVPRAQLANVRPSLSLVLLAAIVCC